MKYRYFLILIIFFCFLNHANAQERSWLVQPTIGVTSPILDNGIGFHVGVNPSVRINQRVSAEGQLSYIYTNISSSFLSGEVGSMNSINALAGGRLYINSEDSNAQIFANLLAGLNYCCDKSSNAYAENEFKLGLSGGTFIEFNRIIIGLAYDTPQNLILKFGYSY